MNRKKPTHLKILQGTYEPSRENRKAPAPSGDLSDPPDWMPEDAAAIWREAVQSAPAGLLKRLDQSVMEVWCTSVASYRASVKAIASEGAIVTGSQGQPVQNPHLRNMTAQASVISRCVREMGFSPSARGSVEVVHDTPAESDPWAAMASSR